MSLGSNSKKVRKGEIESDWFNIEAGVRQGDELSQLLFVIFMEKSNRDTNPQQNHEVLAYTDDVAVVVDTDQELQNVANIWPYSMNNSGMRINTAKHRLRFMNISFHKQEFDIYIWTQRSYTNQSHINTLLS